MRKLIIAVALLALAACQSDESRLEELRLREAGAELDVMRFEREQERLYRSTLDLEISADSVRVIMGPITDSVLRARDELVLVRREMNRFIDGR